MRRVIVGAMVSLDGVMQGPGGPEEDPSGGFSYCGWVPPFANEEAFGEIGELFSGPFDLLLGRRTYEIFAAHWPYAEQGPDDQIARAFNACTKFVATRKGLDLTWDGSVALRDAAADVARLKALAGAPLVTQGSTELVHALMAADLVDEIRLFTFPVVLGRGKKWFRDDAAATAFKLTHSLVASNGIVVTRYERDGAVQTGSFAMDPPTSAELARRDKLAREG